MYTVLLLCKCKFKNIIKEKSILYPDNVTSEERTFLSSLEFDDDEFNKIEQETRLVISLPAFSTCVRATGVINQ